MADRNAPTPLRAYIDVKHGFAFKGQHFCEEPTTHVLVTPGNFAIGGGFQEGKAKYYKGPVPSDYVLREGDLVVTMTDLSKAGDTLGYPALIPDVPNQVYLHNQRIGLISIKDRDQLDRDFLYYLLRTGAYRNHILATASGSTVRHTSPSRIVEFAAELPPLAQQQAAAAVLRALDDKIEQNRRTRQALERLARATFKAWFVDFEPVKAKAAGAAGFPGMSAETFAVLPDCLADSQLSTIPEGWEVQTVGDVTTLSKQQIKPQDHPDELFEHFSIPAYDAGQNPVVEPGSGILSQKFVVVPDCVLLSKLNPRIPRVWMPAPANGRRQIASTEFLVAVPRPAWTREFLYCLFQQSEFRDTLAQSASGTSNSHQRVRPSDLLAHPLVVPPKTVLNAFTDQVRPLIALREALQGESSKLATLRDYLLPRLLTGRVRVLASQQR